MTRASHLLCLSPLTSLFTFTLSAQDTPPETTTSSTCHNGADQGCSGRFVGMVDPSTGKTFNQEANNSDSSVKEISAAPVFPPYVDGSNIQNRTSRPVFVHFQPWFKAPATGTSTYPVPNNGGSDDGPRGYKQVNTSRSATTPATAKWLIGS